MAYGRSGNHVSANALGRQLKQEMVAHPVKAGVLAVGVLLALWFWIPLVSQMLGYGDNTTPSKPSVAAAAPTPASRAAVSSPSTATSQTQKTPTSPATASQQVPWQQLRAWIAADPKMKSAAWPRTERDPFRPLVDPRPAPRPAPGQQVVQKPVVTPESVGLELTGTLVGSPTSVAMISGKSYRFTHTEDGVASVPPYVQARRNDELVRFTLIAVDRKSVTLARDGRRFRLKLEGVVSEDTMTMTPLP
ncbi:MAG: hypothetical protein DWQ42_19355 [Planctomycetota bacterium]|nr:MAG: hypothetical protein DWQ42_19355 [Planctomycetota bacterium]REK37473.1 MAG: hypothetical protein DWQ46_21830 [Planctomycetota bacterium]